MPGVRVTPPNADHRPGWGIEPLNLRARRYALVLGGVCVVVVFVLAVKVHRVDAPLRSDGIVDARLVGLPIPVHLAERVIGLGNPGPFAWIVVALAVVALAWGDRFSAIVAVISCPLAVVATEWIGKPLVGRLEGSWYGFPSGHTTAAAAVASLGALIAYRRWGGRGLAMATPGAVMVPGVMALALVELHSHLFTDTVAGALVGCGSVVWVAWMLSCCVAALGPGAHRGLGEAV